LTLEVNSYLKVKRGEAFTLSESFDKINIFKIWHYWAKKFYYINTFNERKNIFIALSSHHWSLTWASHATDISGVPSTMHSTWEGCWCQFHQCFLHAFFIRKSFFAAFSSYVLALAKNSFKKCARIMMKLATDWGIHNRTHFWSLWTTKRTLCLNHFGANMTTLYFFKYRLPKKLFRGRP